MPPELVALYSKVQEQGARVKALEAEMHDIVERLYKERQTKYRLEQELKGKQRGN
jgi:hypothetical protein